MQVIKSIRPILISGLLIINIAGSHAQTQDGTENNSRLSPKEFSIPASPVFDLMGVTPSQINRTSNIKDFKVDWSFKSWRLNPNLAIESQPIWELLYNRKDIRKYQSASPFMRRLASTDISIGSIQDENSDRRIGFAIKNNIIRQKDPLMAREFYQDITEKFSTEKTDLESRLHQMQTQLDTTTNLLAKPDLRSQITSAQEQLLSLNTRRNAEINTRAKIFVTEHWNASSVDIAYGKIYTYGTDSAGSLKSLRLNRNTGWGAWLNGSLGLGKRFLLSGLIRNTWYEEKLDFTVRNILTQEDKIESAVADNTLISAGLNLRYGGPIYTFFVEFLYEKKGLKTPVAALAEVFTPQDGFEILSPTVKWNVVHPNTLNFGGDWRIGKSVVLNYGMRCQFNNQWKVQTFTPIATINCLMR